ncbi:double zinc ribbon domain-containing protein [Halorubellus salinus]|uniref:double zinc ribbon domain-containing protein n=1 Tax=Halorubellus salinus TaxID=755309 RepID=UPI001D06D35A|nr:zinc ribbon domain-containing protein [Halorubellus salinus]
MSKITVRADDDLVAELEAMDASKSQVVREALRAYLEDVNAGGERLADGDVIEDADGGSVGGADAETLDGLVREHVDEVVRERVDATLADRGFGVRPQPQDVNVTVAVEGAVSDEAGSASDETAEATADEAAGVKSSSDDDGSCAQCGEALDGEHVYCPNCGEKASRRAFCECGDEVRSDWAFCPGCGRRTPAADVLDSG